MSSTKIASIHAREILDSRGRPTLEADVTLANGVMGRAAVPSGASTGTAEACELRDGDKDYYEGRGVRKAVANANGELARALIGIDTCDQKTLDAKMIALDGTTQLSRLGANAILAISLASARAAAQARNIPLYRWIAQIADVPQPTMPLPMVNILSGGLHAGRGMDIQDFLAMPIGATSYAQALQWVSLVRASANVIIQKRGLTTLLADEGGLSPGFEDSRDALDVMVEAFEHAGLRPGTDIAIVLDVAATSLLDDKGNYHFARAGRTLKTAELADTIISWVKDYPIISVEDPLGEEDWAAWAPLTKTLSHIQIVGDDLFATNPQRIAKGISMGVANCALIKVNQNGTLSGTLEAIKTARDAGYKVVISARSGETEDPFIADLAVGTNGGQIKIGSVRSSERLAKYNQLLRIEEDGLPFASRSGLAGTAVK